MNPAPTVLMPGGRGGARCSFCDDTDHDVAIADNGQWTAICAQCAAAALARLEAGSILRGDVPAESVAVDHASCASPRCGNRAQLLADDAGHVAPLCDARLPATGWAQVPPALRFSVLETVWRSFSTFPTTDADYQRWDGELVEALRVGLRELAEIGFVAPEVPGRALLEALTGRTS